MMQAAKDSFYMTLCARLQQVNPNRTIVIGGEVRPAIVAAENEPGAPVPLADAFCLEWGSVKPMSESALLASSLMAAEMTIRYGTCGANNGEGDRGRALTAMDAELMAICTPALTMKMDYSQAAPIALGSNVFWMQPSLGAALQAANLLSRVATMTVYFYPEIES